MGFYTVDRHASCGTWCPPSASWIWVPQRSQVQPSRLWCRWSGSWTLSDAAGTPGCTSASLCAPWLAWCSINKFCHYHPLQFAIPPPPHRTQPCLYHHNKRRQLGLVAIPPPNRRGQLGIPPQQNKKMDCVRIPSPNRRGQLGIPPQQKKKTWIVLENTISQ